MALKGEQISYKQGYPQTNYFLQIVRGREATEEAELLRGQQEAAKPSSESAFPKSDTRSHSCPQSETNQRGCGLHLTEMRTGVQLEALVH